MKGITTWWGLYSKLLKQPLADDSGKKIRIRDKKQNPSKIQLVVSFCLVGVFGVVFIQRPNKNNQNRQSSIFLDVKNTALIQFKGMTGSNLS